MKPLIYTNGFGGNQSGTLGVSEQVRGVFRTVVLQRWANVVGSNFAGHVGDGGGNLGFSDLLLRYWGTGCSRLTYFSDLRSRLSVEAPLFRSWIFRERSKGYFYRLRGYSTARRRMAWRRYRFRRTPKRMYFVRFIRGAKRVRRRRWNKLRRVVRLQSSGWLRNYSKFLFVRIKQAMFYRARRPWKIIKIKTRRSPRRGKFSKVWLRGARFKGRRRRKIIRGRSGKPLKRCVYKVAPAYRHKYRVSYITFVKKGKLKPGRKRIVMKKIYILRIKKKVKPFRVPKILWWRRRRRWHGYWRIFRKRKSQKSFHVIRAFRRFVLKRARRWFINNLTSSGISFYKNPAIGRWWVAGRKFPHRRRRRRSRLKKLRVFAKLRKTLASKVNVSISFIKAPSVVPGNTIRVFSSFFFIRNTFIGV